MLVCPLSPLPCYTVIVTTLLLVFLWLHSLLVCYLCYCGPLPFYSVTSVIEASLPCFSVVWVIVAPLYKSHSFQQEMYGHLKFPNYGSWTLYNFSHVCPITLSLCNKCYCGPITLLHVEYKIISTQCPILSPSCSFQPVITDGWIIHTSCGHCITRSDPWSDITAHTKG